MTQTNIFQRFFGKRDAAYFAIEEAICLLQRNDYDGAVDILVNRALQSDPYSRRALLHLGVARMLQGRLDEAEDILLSVAARKEMDSEKAAAQIALERVLALRKERQAKAVAE